MVAERSIVERTGADASADRVDVGLRAALPYLPGLDGLRAIAVVAVLVYHADYSWLPGGFLGVDVFFVLSGYLITALLIIEWQHSGRVDLRSFWWRRARRLLPAVFLLLAGVLAYASIFLRSEIGDLRVDALAALGYATNWWLVIEERSYFEAMGRPSLFQHLWSLAVEEQFYLFWPILFAVLMRWWRRWAPVVLLGGVAASTGLMWYMYEPYADPSRIYYGTDTRSAALLLGALLAYFWRPATIPGTGGVEWTGPRWSSIHPTTWLGRRVPALIEVVGIAAIAALILLFFRLNEFEPRLYQGGFLVTALVTTTAIAVVTYPRARLVPWVLGLAPLRWLGTRSYGIYLWHWPIFMVTRPHLDVPLDGLALFAVRLALTLTLAELSYRLVEAPIREGALGLGWRRWWRPGVRGWRLAPRRALTAVPVAAVVGFVVVIASVTTVAEEQQGASSIARDAASGPLAVTDGQVARLDPAPTPGFAIAPFLDPAPMETPWVWDVPVVNPPGGGGAGSGEPDEVVAAPSEEPVDSPSSVSVFPTGEEDMTDLDPDPGAASPASSSGSPGGSGLASPAQPSADAAPVTAIGDSVMLGAESALAQVLPGVRVDGEVGMQASRALDMLRGLHASGGIADHVVIHIGSNGIVRESEFVELMELLAHAERVVIVNVKVPRAWEHQNNNLFAKMVRQYPNAFLVDWHGASSGEPDYFWTDGIHLRPEGAAIYSSMIAGELQ